MKPLFCICLLLITLVPLARSHAAVILIIDISDPSNVSFTATSAFSSGNDFGDTWLEDGITLLGFFSSSAYEGDLEFFDSSDLRSPGGTFEYTMFVAIDMNPMGSDYFNLNIFGSGFSDQNFSTTMPALTGSAIGDLSLWVSHLRAGTGDVQAGGNQYGSAIIGQYVVIPDPSVSALFIGSGALTFIFIRRRIKGRIRYCV